MEIDAIHALTTARQVTSPALTWAKTTSMVPDNHPVRGPDGLLERAYLERLIQAANEQLSRRVRTQSVRFVLQEVNGHLMVQLLHSGRLVHQYPSEKILNNGTLLSSVGAIQHTVV